MVGTSLTVTVNGINFEPGVSVSFGAGVTVTSTTVVSSRELAVAIEIPTLADAGPRDVTVTNPGGRTGTRAGGFTVTLPPATISLSFLGKLRDKVGQGSTAFSADGALDGTFRVIVQGGIWARTVTRLELRGTTGGVWDTDGSTVHWALGAAASLDAALLNGSNGAVSFAVADGGAFFVFASDLNPTAFSGGSSFTLTANFVDGTTASATATVPVVPTISSVAPSAGTPGASLTVTVTGTSFQTGASAAFGAGVTVSATTVVSSTQLSVAIAIGATAALGPRDVTVTNPDGQAGIRAGGFTVAMPPPTLSLAFLGKLRDKVGQGNTAFSPDGALDGSFQVTVGAGSGARTVTKLELRRSAGGVWDTDGATANWALGAAASLDGALLNGSNGAVSFAVADGSGFVLFAADSNSFTAGSSFTLTANFVDGTTASATATVPVVPTISSVAPSAGAPGASLPVTVTGTSFQTGASASFGAGVTVSSTTVVSSTQLSVAIAIASAAALGPRDVTVTNPDGQAAIRTSGFTVAMPPPTLSLTFLGKLRDKVGQGNTAFSPDGALDGTFQVTVGAGSGARTVTKLELRRSAGGVWDTDGVTANWALGAAASLDGALLNGSNGAVSFAVADGSGFVLFAADSNSFTAGSSFTLTANFVDGTTASATATVPVVPTISSVAPSAGAPGASLTVTVTGTSFQTGASAAFGAGITVSSTTVVSSTQLSVAIAIGAAAALGPRDVTVTNPDGQAAIRTGGFTVALPPPTLSLAFLGKLRDKVGQGNTAFSPDGALDGPFQVTVGAGSGARTVTKLELRRSAGGVWDTDGVTANWALGAAASLDGALLNGSNGAVSFAVADGSGFVLFAADSNSFTAGSSFTLTANFVDGTTASATATVPVVPTISRVAPSAGAPGASLTVTVTGTSFQTGASASFGAGVTVSSTTVVSSTQLSVAIAIGAAAALGPRDVTVTNPDGQAAIRTGGFTVALPPPTLSLAFLGKLRDKVGQGNTAFSPDGALDGSFQVTVGAGSGARTVTRLELRASSGVWDTDGATANWALGAAASLDGALLNGSNGAVNFAVADSSVFVLFAADPSAAFTSGTSFTLTANFADGTTASATATVPVVPTISSVAPSAGAPGASLTVTVTGTSFQTGASAAFGAGVTVSSTTVVSSTQLSVAIAIGATAALGPRDVTVTNPGGQTGTRAGGFTVTLPPATLSLAFLGKLRDRVGQVSLAFSPDGALDGIFQVTVGAGSGARTVTRLELRASSGVWDTDGATANWALGAAASLDGALLNGSNGAVNFAVADSSVFVLFAADPSAAFTSGTSFTLTANFADGTTASATATVPVVPTISSVAPS